MKENDYKLINMNDVEIEQVEWLWEGYIPVGKLTILQGDSGKGKTMAMLNLIAAFTTGRDLLDPPGSPQIREPINVIYQTAEDGLADTVKPRLVAAGADCSRVSVIDEGERMLSMTDERLIWAIRETDAGLVVLDPIQAYLGENVDMHRANEVRPRLKHLGDIAAVNSCGMVLIGHLNKKDSGKPEYRGLGSIDFTAAARSVILCAESPRDRDVRVLASTKCSLTYPPDPVAFRLSKERGFEWEGTYDITAEELLQITRVKGQKTIAAKAFLASPADNSCREFSSCLRLHHLGKFQGQAKNPKKAEQPLPELSKSDKTGSFSLSQYLRSALWKHG